jgi:protein TonB
VRGSAAILVIAAHVIVIYAIAVSLRVVDAPAFLPPLTGKIIQTVEPIVDPAPPVSRPDIQQQGIYYPVPDPIDVPLPEPDPDSRLTMTTEPPIVAPTPLQSGSPPVIERTSLQVTRRIDPVYPPAAIRGNEEGTVRLRLLVDERGHARDVQVATSSGSNRLDEAAVKAVRRWQFAPATQDSRAVSAWTEVNVVFRLDH